MQRTPGQELIHNKLIARQVRYFSLNGYTHILADHIDLPAGKPDLLDGYRPDISASLQQFKIIAEAETSDSLTCLETVKQWQALANSGYQFQVIIPIDCLVQAQKMAQAHNISIARWWGIDLDP